MDDTLRQARNRDALACFIGVAAHDLNNLLMVFQSAIALLAHPLDPEARKRLLDGMQRAVEQGATLTRRMREFAEHRPSDLRTIEPRELISTMQKRLAGALQQHVRLELDCDGAIDRVKVCPADLELALVNLCLNSQEAMPQGGTIHVALRNTPEGVAISVADGGVGMTEEVRSRAFEPFFTTRQRGPLSGLGLSQVYAFALQSEGQIKLRSEPGRGTTVEIALPRAE